MSRILQSGVRFQALPTPELRLIIAKWIGCQRIIFNGKVTEGNLFASQRRLQLASGETDIKTPLDRCYAQFKDDTLTPWLSEVPSQILRNGADRWMDAKQRQLKGLARAPRIRSRNNFNSVIITNELFRFMDIADPVTGKVKNHLVLGTENNPIGILDFNAHCAFGVPKQITVRRSGRHWWLSFSYAHAPPEGFTPRDDAELAYELGNLSDAELNLATIGIDRNVKDNCVATSDGRFFGLQAIQKARLTRKEIGAKRIQKRMARQVKGSKNRSKTRSRLAAKHECRSNVARDFSHQTSHALVCSPANDDRAPLLLVLEALKVANMVRRPKAKQDPVTGKWLKNRAAQKAGLHKAILLSCWGSIATQVKYKGFRASALVLSVPAAYSSQECSHCSHTQPENRFEQRFICRSCGYMTHADTNAGKVIAKRGIGLVRDQKVIVKACKRTAYKRRKPKETKSVCDKEILGREPSGVPVDARVSQGEAQAISLQQQTKQEDLIAKSDAPTTAQGV
jgi:putative transposase